MTRYLLDTNIISDITKPAPSASVLVWFSAIPDESLFISTLSIAEIKRGILEKAAGRKRRELEDWFAGPEGPQQLFAGRILGFDESAALEWARLMAEGSALGAPRSAIDMMVAAIASAHACVVLTGNERHFRGVVAMVNPMAG